MTWFTGIVAFVCIWWVVLFAVLPWNIRRASDKEVQTGPGAPEKPHIKEKFLATTVFTFILWLAVYLMVDANLVDFRKMAEKMAQKDYNSTMNSQAENK